VSTELKRSSYNKRTTVTIKMAVQDSSILLTNLLKYSSEEQSILLMKRSKIARR